MKNKKKNVFIIVLLIIVVLPILLSFVKCDNSADHATAETRIQHEINYSRQVKKANNNTWIGTAVPSVGVISELYINNTLSIEETRNILSQLFYVENIYVFMYGPLENFEGEMAGSITSILGEYIISVGYSPIFSTNIIPEEGVDFVGWNPGLEFNENVLIFQGNNFVVNSNITIFEEEGMLQQNEFLSQLISVTPFQQAENKTTLQVIYEELGTGLTALTSGFVVLFTSLTPVFWNNSQPTIITILVLAGVLIVLGFWGIDKLLTLFKVGLGGKK